MDTCLEYPLERILQNSITPSTGSLDTKVSLVETTSSVVDLDGINLVKDWNSGKKEIETKTFKLRNEEEARGQLSK